MKVIYYGESNLYYDISAACSNCGFRHVARIPQGVEINRNSACPHCGIGRALVYGTTRTAFDWLKPGSEEPPRCCVCNRLLRLAQEILDRPEDIPAHCVACWNKAFLASFENPAVDPENCE